MKRYTILLVLLYLLVAGICAMAQGVPADSKKASVTQRLGLSDVHVTYHRPNVKGREIFGNLVPYGEVWRTGADYPTFIRLSDTTYIGGDSKPLPPGKYALYTLPQAKQWTVILSKDTTLWGAYGYKQDNDILRFQVGTVRTSDFAESFTIGFEDINDDNVNLYLHWANTKVSFPLYVNIKDRVVAYVRGKMDEKSTEGPDWGLPWAGANYLLKNKADLELANEWVNKSLAIEEHWFNAWTKAQIMAARSEYDEAVKWGNKAISIGLSEEQKPYFPYEKIWQAEIKKWGKKSGKQ